jgi:hypothetical protein
MTNLDQLPGHGFTLSLFPVKGEHDRRARARRRIIDSWRALTCARAGPAPSRRRRWDLLRKELDFGALRIAGGDDGDCSHTAAHPAIPRIRQFCKQLSNVHSIIE